MGLSAGLGAGGLKMGSGAWNCRAISFQRTLCRACLPGADAGLWQVSGRCRRPWLERACLLPDRRADVLLLHVVHPAIPTRRRPSDNQVQSASICREQHACRGCSGCHDGNTWGNGDDESGIDINELIRSGHTVVRLYASTKHSPIPGPSPSEAPRHDEVGSACRSALPSWQASPPMETLRNTPVTRLNIRSGRYVLLGRSCLD